MMNSKSQAGRCRAYCSSYGFYTLIGPFEALLASYSVPPFPLLFDVSDGLWPQDMKEPT